MSEAEEDQDNQEESEKERRDRELIELLNELRVALPGVQVLFTFLLIVPFSNGFPKMTGLQRDVFFVSFLCTAVSAVLFIAPSAYHRLRFRAHDKEQMLRTANRLAISGSVFLALGMSSVVYLISDLLFGTVTSVVISALVGLAFGWFWYGLALSRRLSERRRGVDETGEPTGRSAAA
jgi:hypothetical protein